MTIAGAVREVFERGYGPPRTARDPVNPAMVNSWLEALGDANPRYAAEGVAPPAMTQVWTMRGLHPRPDPGDPLSAMTAILDEAGFTSVVATNCTQTYHRYLRHGELVSVRSRLVDVTGPKRTALGEGWFVTTESTWSVDDEPVATMVFRVLKFRPGVPPATTPPAAAAPATAAPATAPPSAAPPTAAPPATAPPEAAPPDVLRPMVSPDTEFFWAGTALGELRVQRCSACGRLRHPPGPGCPDCGALEPDHVVASGTGVIYSYVVHHHPPVPGRTLPFVIVLVELAEGVRMLGELVGGGDARIGAPVRVEFLRVDDELTLPAWRLVAS